MTLQSIDRRRLLALGGGVALSAAGASAALSAVAGERKFILVILRGALDGLAAAAPYADPAYQRLRGRLGLGAPGTPGGVLPLAEGFGLHPKLAFLHGEWKAGALGLMHAAASPYRDRSHFDGQDVLESGGAAVYALTDGWMNRALQIAPARSGVAVASVLPLVLRGGGKASSYAPSFAPAANADTVHRLMDLYAEDPLLGPALAAAVETGEIAGEAGMAEGGSRPRGVRPEAQWPQLAGVAARLLSAPDGPAAAVLAFDGWDTHANQGAAEGLLAGRLAALDESLKALKTGLGAAWASSLVVVATEFGRTVAINGTGGTDHGTGGAAFTLGGKAKGGLIGDWPGLAALHQNRDLQPANDLRALFAAALGEHWGLSRADLAARVFPGSAGAKRIEGIVRA